MKPLPRAGWENRVFAGAADDHIKASKPQATCQGSPAGIWTAGAPDPTHGCMNLSAIAPEYRE
jgi:hypothetical protein